MTMMITNIQGGPKHGALYKFVNCECAVERCSIYLNIQTGILGIATQRYNLHNFRENTLH